MDANTFTGVAFLTLFLNPPMRFSQSDDNQIVIFPLRVIFDRSSCYHANALLVLKVRGQD